MSFHACWLQKCVLFAGRLRGFWGPWIPGVKVFLVAEGEDGNTDSDGVIGLCCQDDVISKNNRQKFAQYESLDVDINCRRKHACWAWPICPSPFVEIANRHFGIYWSFRLQIVSYVSTFSGQKSLALFSQYRQRWCKSISWMFCHCRCNQLVSFCHGVTEKVCSTDVWLIMV